MKNRREVRAARSQDYVKACWYMVQHNVRLAAYDLAHLIRHRGFKA